MTSQYVEQFSATAKKNIELWLTGAFCDEKTKEDIRRAIQKHPEEIENSFYTSLSFGTGGLRGLMGMGPNRMNIYTIRETTKGIANYVSRFHSHDQKQLSAVIGYDSRHHSKEFAFETARVFAAAGFRVYLFADICPTPLVSFACRHLQASTAVMITASHNPPEYNGYKVYWSDGGQVLPPHDAGMIQEVEKVRAAGEKIDLADEDSSLISLLGEEIDDAYFQAIERNRLWSISDKSSLKAVYSCLHGTGGRLMSRALRNVGITSLSYVDQQMIPDGSFPTVKKPNPEESQALLMGIEKMKAEGSDVFIATDPDADRLGVVCLHNNEPVILTGNQIAAIACEWIFRQLQENNTMPKRAGIVKTIVTTTLLEAIAKRWNAHCANVLTGFKYIAETIEAWLQGKDGGYTFVFGGEESYGSLYGLHARDKDAITTAAAIAEIAWHMKEQGKTLVDALHELHSIYGAFYEELITLNFEESKEGREKMAYALDRMRRTPPSEIGGIPVAAAQDLLSGACTGLEQYWLSKELPRSDVVIYTLVNDGQVIIRPSGTEPKVKVYLLLRGDRSDGSTLDDLAAQGKKLAASINEFLT